MIGGVTPSTWNFGSNWPGWREIADFQFIFARSASAAKPSRTSSVNRNRKSTASFPMSLIWTLPLSSHRVAQKRKMSKIRTIICDCFETVRDRMPVVLITNRKSHTGFRLVPTSMTLNDLKRHNSPYMYFAFFPLNSIALQADYVTVVEYRSTMSVKYYLPVPVFHFWPKLTHPTARSLCDS